MVSSFFLVSEVPINLQPIMLHLFKPGVVSACSCWLLSFKTVSQLWTAWDRGVCQGRASLLQCKQPEGLGFGVFFFIAFQKNVLLMLWLGKRMPS